MKLLRKFLPFLLLLAIALLLWLHRVPQRITAEDRAYLDRFLQNTSAAEATTYEEELAQIAAIQQAVLAHAPLGDPIPEGQPREPRQLWEHRQGGCYDISRTLEKALRYRGYRTRHAALYEQFWRRSSRSHAATEVRTREGWLIVENTAPWIGLDTAGMPWSFARLYDQPHPPAWLAPPPTLVQDFYHSPHTVIYGLYSRHGRFFPPYTPIPDVGWK